LKLLVGVFSTGKYSGRTLISHKIISNLCRSIHTKRPVLADLDFVFLINIDGTFVDTLENQFICMN
jgi:hypothetical protein